MCLRARVCCSDPFMVCSYIITYYVYDVLLVFVCVYKLCMYYTYCKRYVCVCVDGRVGGGVSEWVGERVGR